MLESEILNILRKVRSGEVSVSEAAERLGAFEETIEVIPPPPPVDENITLELGWWKYAWLLPVSVGAGLFIVSAFLTSWAYVNERLFWFYCSWLPLFLGLLVLLLGLWSAQARWVHVRVQEEGGRGVSISVPLPLGLPGWLLRMLAARIPGLREQPVQQFITILDALRKTREPVVVEVNEKDGDRVRVYIL